MERRPDSNGVENLPAPEKPGETGAETPSHASAPVAKQPIPPAMPSAKSKAKLSSGTNKIVPDETDAEDVDIIEKPWVEKAEEIIIKNREKPYEEEEEQEDLQIDYLKKRFGKEIRKSKDNS